MSFTPRTLAALKVTAACLALTAAAADASDSGVPSLHTSGVIRIVEHPLIHLNAGGPATAKTVIAVNEKGMIVFSEPRDSGGHLVRIVDSVGRVIRDVGGSADRVSPLGRVAVLLAHDSSIAIYSAGRLHWFRADGTPLREQLFGPTQGPIALSRDSVDVADVADFITGRGPVSIDRLPRTSGTPRRLFAASNEQFRGLLRSPDDTAAFVLPAYATDGPRVLLGNGMAYHLAIFFGTRMTSDLKRQLGLRLRTDSERRASVDSAEQIAKTGTMAPDGSRHVVPLDRRVLDSVLARPQEHFSGRASSIALDGPERVWIAGSTSTGAFLDLFVAGRFLDRVTLPCQPSPRGVAVTPPWLVLVCKSSARSEPLGPPSLHLYRFGIHSRPQ
jgi:hypothetical protein